LALSGNIIFVAIGYATRSAIWVPILFSDLPINLKDLILVLNLSSVIYFVPFDKIN
jgi:hypothetical protein